MHDPTITPNRRAARNEARRSPSCSPEAHQPAARVHSEDAARYDADSVQAAEQAILDQAEAILYRRFIRGATFDNPRTSCAWLRVKYASKPAEVFGMVLLDNRHRVIETRELFHGTIDGCSVPPREVVRAVIEANAAACVLFHNHPSGIPEPSGADRALTDTLKNLLDQIGCRVLDHLVIGAETICSFAERGLL